MHRPVDEHIQCPSSETSEEARLAKCVCSCSCSCGCQAGDKAVSSGTGVISGKSSQFLAVQYTPHGFS
jgi:hypothetical protein